MAEFLLSVHHDYSRPLEIPGVDPEDMYRDVAAINQALQDAGAWVFAGGLLPPDSAAVVDASGEHLTITDGPRAQAVLHLGGFWVIDVADLESAQDWAVRASRATRGPVEVRPFQG